MLAHTIFIERSHCSWLDIGLSVERAHQKPCVWSTHSKPCLRHPPSTSKSSQPDSQREIFIKERTQYKQCGCYCLGLQKSWIGICAIELQDGAPVSFVSHCSIPNIDFGRERLKRASRPNLLHLKEILVDTDRVVFIYDQWSMTLGELWRLTPVFQLGGIEVAMICNGVCEQVFSMWTRNSMRAEDGTNCV